MKTLRLHAPTDLRLHEEPLPTPAAGEALLRVKAVGICASDLHWFGEAGIGDARLEHPLVLGHEFSAVIEPPGFSSLPPGTRVAVDPSAACGVCEFCQLGHPNLCLRLRFAGHSQDDGALREYTAWPASSCFPIPDSLSDADGAMLEPLGVAIHAVDLGHIKPGMTVGVYGCGPIGLLTLQMARLTGATRLIATDPLPHRLQAARESGATLALRAEGGAERLAILAATNSRGVDIAFEAAGENPAVETAIETTRAGGRVVLIGIPSDDRISFNASTARRKGLTIALARRMKHTYPRAIELVSQGRVDVRSIVSHRFPMSEFRRAFETAARREGIKVVLEP